MADSLVITGRVEVFVNGLKMLAKKDVTVRLGGVKRNAVIENEYLGSTEEAVAGEIEMEVIDRSDVSLSAIAAIDGNGTVYVSAIGDGKKYVLYNAVCESALEIKTNAGGCMLKFFGPPVEELMPA